MNETGGVTLRVDADTARYIAGIARAAQANQGLISDTKGLGGVLNQLTSAGVAIGQTFASWAGPIGLASAGVAVLDSIMASYTKKLDDAKKAWSEIAGLNQSIIASGRGSEAGAIRGAIDAAAPTMSGQQKVAFYRSYSTNNPNATAGQYGSAATAANSAAILGRDVGQFSDIMGQLDRAGVKDAGDMTNYLMQNAPGVAEKAAQAIAKSPQNAAEIAQTVATAGRGGKGTVSLVNQALAAFVQQGGRGSLSANINTRTAGPGGADDLRYMLDPSNRAPAFVPGGLANAEALARADQEVGAQIIVRESEERSQDNAYGLVGEKARRKAVGKALENEQDARHGEFYNLARDTVGDLFRGSFSEKSATQLNHYTSIELLKEIAADNKKRNAPSAPRVSRHGENGP